MKSPAATPTKKKHRHTRTTSTPYTKTEIAINIYDLLPPGHLSSALWLLGSSLLHTGVHVKALNREYAFGGHSRPGMSGVYWTRPGSEPPGGTFRSEHLQGFTVMTIAEIENVIRKTSDEFPGQAYNLLTNNCNHFTNVLCERLTGKTAPSWLNRAARVGLALPCVVPREWIEPPEADTADGELVDANRTEDEDERTGMLREDYEERARQDRASRMPTSRVNDGHSDELDADEQTGKGKGKGRAHASRPDRADLPAIERAPLSL